MNVLAPDTDALWCCLSLHYSHTPIVNGLEPPSPRLIDPDHSFVYVQHDMYPICIDVPEYDLHTICTEWYSARIIRSIIIHMLTLPDDAHDNTCTNLSVCEAPGHKNHMHSSHLYIRWNNYLIKAFSDRMHAPWALYVIHGFVSQSCLSVYGRSIYVGMYAKTICANRNVWGHRYR